MARTSRLHLGIAAALACAVLFVVRAPAQPPGWNNPRQFDPFYLGARVTLGPDWLFSPDDNPAFAASGYDDSGWMTVSVDKPLDSYGIHDARHVWYRIHIHGHRRARYLTIETQYINGAYELYVNGKLLGAGGDMESRYQSQQFLRSFEIPEDMLTGNVDLVIAIRTSVDRTGPDGVGSVSPFNDSGIILASLDAAARDASYVASHESIIPFMLAGLALVAGLVALALYLAMRSRAEYLAIAVSLLAGSAQATVVGWDHLRLLTLQGHFFETLFLSINVVAGAEFVRLILHLERSRWLLALEIAVFAGYFGADLGLAGILSPLSILIVYFLPPLILNVVLPVLLFRGLRRGNRDARVILIVVAVASIANYWNFLATLGDAFHLSQHIPDLPSIKIKSYEMYFWEIYWALYDVTILIFLVLRTIGIAREAARVAAELEAARVVQHVLIPDEIPAVPGFALESVYKPAGEVGGDFFQIVPTLNGGVLVVIGDVSGKGMPAAMTVSLLVGTFRTLAHYTQSPAEILSAMNTRMLARSHGGFTTCLVLRIDSDGVLTVANAGHIAPYLAGKELALENGLPLGLSATASYVEDTIQLAPGRQVTLVTDGVVEARDKTGALFGFERTAAVSTQAATQIAEAAELFGQEDDITALTLAVVPAPEPAPA
jgi:sigma-B regulation protein RsbU (phosphoserine phosphatase)